MRSLRSQRALSHRYQNLRLPHYSQVSRIVLLMVFCMLAFLAIVVRLFYLQVIKYDEYSTTAKEQHYGAITLTARRGEILTRDPHSDTFSKLATNTTLDLLYVDPLVAEDKVGIAQKLAPLVFNEEDYNLCKEKIEECTYNIVIPQVVPALEAGVPPVAVATSASASAPLPAPAEAPLGEPQFKPYIEMIDLVAADLLKRISRLELTFVALKRNASPELMTQIMNLRLPGVFVDAERHLIYGDPTLIPENRLNEVALKLAPPLDTPQASLAKDLSRRKTRYVFLKNRLSPEASTQITAMNLSGVVLIPEHWRFYPENNLASNLIGFLNRENTGQYGVEAYFNTELEGKKGKIYAESDPFGRQITVGGESKIVGAVNGDNVILTIDRIVQKKVEQILAEDVERYHADSGQVLIMDPFTGAVIAMANFPNFNPNDFGGIYEMRPVLASERDKLYSTTPVFKKNDKGEFVKIEVKDWDDAAIQKFIYMNRRGPEAYKNKLLSEAYEPGSVFKPITYAVGIDSKEIEPQMTYDDNGPLKIDDFEIKNATGHYYGHITLTEALEKSLNTGAAYVGKKLGKELFYKYIKDFGFGEYTHVELDGEVKGKLDFYKRWSKAQLLTTSFGQGLSVTGLQMITAWSALANGGKLMQPYIVDSIQRGKQTIKTEPQVIRRVISEDTSSIITAMLVSSVERGVAHAARLDDQVMAGKTGTAQIAGKGSQYEKGEGTTITSFMGYLPAMNPKFVMLVKFDRPRIGINTWGETTAAPTFKRIAQFLVDHYSIPPSR